MSLIFLDSPEFNLEARVNFTITSEQFDSDGVTATLEWAQGSSLHSYRISVVPPSRNVISSGSRSERVRLQVKALYDIQYNVSVVPSLCGHSGTTSSTTLHYGKYIIILTNAIRMSFKLSPILLTKLIAKLLLTVKVQKLMTPLR